MNKPDTLFENIQVCIRIRPLQINWEDKEIWFVDSKSSQIFCSGKEPVPSKKSKSGNTLSSLCFQFSNSQLFFKIVRMFFSKHFLAIYQKSRNFWEARKTNNRHLPQWIQWDYFYVWTNLLWKNVHNARKRERKGIPTPCPWLPFWTKKICTYLFFQYQYISEEGKSWVFSLNFLSGIIQWIGEIDFQESFNAI